MMEMVELEGSVLFIIASRFELSSDNSRDITVIKFGIDCVDSDGSYAVLTPSDL